MNDHDLLERLDQRADTAAADLNAVAASRPTPGFDPTGVRLTPVTTVGRRWLTRPLVGIAAAAVLLAGAGAWWVAVENDGTPDPADTPESPVTVEPRPFVATELPAGLVMKAAFDGRSGDEDVIALGPATVYGPSDTEPNLLVYVLGEWRGGQLGGEGVERFEVDGRTAYATELAVGGGGAQVTVPIDYDRAIVLGSPSLGRDELARLATRTTVEDLRATVPDDALPEGWRSLLVEPDAMGMFSPLSSFGPGPLTGPWSVYSAGDNGETIAELGSVAGGEAKMYAPTLFAERFEDATVRGHPALVVEYPETSDYRVVVVTWSEKPGELVRLSGVGLSVGEMLSIAEGVRPVSAAEFTDLVERSKLGGLDADPADTVGEGRFADGSRWVLRQGTDGSTPSPELNVAITDDTGGSSSQSSSGSSSGSESGRGLVAVTTVEYEDRTFAAGFVTDDVVAVELRQPDGSVLGDAEVVTGAGHTGWVTELTVPATVAVALDANGNEVGRTTLTRSGNILDGRAAVTTPATEVPGS